MDDKTLEAKIKSFFDMAGFTSTPEKTNPTADKFGRLLPISISFLQSLGVGLDDIPNNEQLEQLDTYLHTLKNRLGKQYNKNTISDWKRHTQNFFIYSHKSKGDTNMMTENAIMGLEPELEIITPNSTPAEDSAVSEEQEPAPLEFHPDEYAQPVTPDDMPPNAEPAKKPGRPTKGKEERDKKLTVNIPTSVFNDIKDLAHIDNVTIPDIINDIFEKAAQQRASDIQAIRSLRAKRR